MYHVYSGGQQGHYPPMIHKYQLANRNENEHLVSTVRSVDHLGMQGFDNRQLDRT